MKEAKIFVISIIVVGLFVLAFGLTGCTTKKTDSAGKSKSGNTKAASGKSGVKADKIDAVRLLKAAKPAQILGEPADDPESNVDMTSDKKRVSQATAWATSQAKLVGLMIRYASDETMASSRAEWADEQRLGDQDAVDAVKAGQDISGLGDVAFYYEWFDEQNVVVIWDQHYQMTVLIKGFSDPADGVARAKKTAERVLAQLQ